MGVVGPSGVEEGGRGEGVRVGLRVLRLKIEGKACWGGMEAGRVLSERSSVGWEVVDDGGDGSGLLIGKRAEGGVSRRAPFRLSSLDSSFSAER